MLKISEAFALRLPQSNGDATALCALPYDAKETAKERVSQLLSEALRFGRFTELGDVVSPEGTGDVLLEALLKYDEVRSGSSLIRKTQRSSTKQSRGQTTELWDDPQIMAGVRIVASPYSPTWFIDLREIGALWASLLRWDGEFEVQLISYEGGPTACQLASEAYLVLAELKGDLEELAGVFAGGMPGQDFDATRPCPDSLMSIGQNCLDFYIAGITADMILLGDNRSSNAYASIKQSKVHVIDDFNNNRVSVMLSGSHIVTYNVMLNGGSPYIYPSGLIPFPLDSAAQVRYMRVDSLGPDHRTIELSVANGVCTTFEHVLQARFPSGVPRAIMRAACPEIDAKIWYVRDGSSWRVSHVERDAMPNLDIIRKMPDGTLQVINSSTKRPGPAAFWLMGINKLIYDVQEEMDQMLQEMNAGGCYLQ